jgi:Spy/CpxP family protein refolding chaperone
VNIHHFTTRLAVTVIGAALLCGAGTSTHAQRPRNGGSSGGGLSAPSATRLDLLVAGFTLTKDQEKQIKTILDTEFKAAAPIKKQLVEKRMALGMAIQTSKSDAEIDAATSQYAEQAAAMTQAETKALAKVVQVLTEDQRKNQTAMTGAVGMMRGIFYGKKWDIVPDVRFY